MDAEKIFQQVIAAMQDAEEMGGPDGRDYIALMQRIEQEAARRAATYAAIIGVELNP